MRTHVLATGALAVLLVTAGCAGVLTTDGSGGVPAAQADSTPTENIDDAAATNDAADAPDRSNGKTIRVAAGGTVRAQPDRAVLRVAVEVQGGNASVARRRLAENVSRLRTALEEMGIGPDQVTTAYFDISRDRHHGPRKEDAGTVFRGFHALTITLSDVNRTGDVIVAAVENGATDVDRVEFTLSEEARNELRHEALAEAVESARAKAETIAEASASLSADALSVRSVRTADVGVRFDGGKVAMATEAAGAGTSIEGGEVTVTARVVVTYNTTGT